MVSPYNRGNILWVKYYRDGKKRRHALRTKDKDIAKREVVTLEAELLDPHLRVKEARDPSTGAFLDAHLEWALARKRPRAIEESKRAYVEFMDFAKIDRVAAATRQDIVRYIHYLLEKGARRSQSTTSCAMSRPSSGAALGKASTPATTQ